jgi:hypothetical protein
MFPAVDVADAGVVELERVRWTGGATANELLLVHGAVSVSLTDLTLDGGSVMNAALAVTADTLDVDGVEALGVDAGGPLLFAATDRIVGVRHVTSRGSSFVAAALDVAAADGASVIPIEHLLLEGNEGDGVRITGAARLSSVTVAGGGAVLVPVLPQAPVEVDSAVFVGNDQVVDTSAAVTFTRTWAWDNGSVAADGTVPDGVFVADPGLVRYDAGLDSALWDLHLRLDSPAADLGDPALRDPDGTLADVGAYAGPESLPWYNADDDADGLPDGWELAEGALDPAEDLDGDTLDALAEYLLGTRPGEPDTDGDSSGDAMDGAPLDPASF